MRITVPIRPEFGTHLADGAKAMEFRINRIDPYVSLCDDVVLDFTGVRSANSSFMNALIVGLVEHHGMDVFDRLTFKGCTPAIRVLIEAAAELGARKIQGRVGA